MRTHSDAEKKRGHLSTLHPSKEPTVTIKIVDIVDQAVKHSFEYHCNNKQQQNARSNNCLNSLEKLACDLQLGCLWKRDLYQAFVNKKRIVNLCWHKNQIEIVKY